MNLFRNCICLVLMVAAVNATAQQMQTVPRVDLSRYSGTWYEIARMPNRFQAQCVANVSAEYIQRDDGQIEVVNRCQRADGTMEAANGRARIVEQTTNAKLKVRFAPVWLSWLPAVWGDYWVLELAADYSYAVVGEPSRQYLWILARHRSLSDATYQEILQRLTRHGYDPATLLKTKQQS